MDRSVERENVAAGPDLLGALISPEFRSSSQSPLLSTEALSQVFDDLRRNLVALAGEVVPHVREFCEANHENLRIVEGWVLPNKITVPGIEGDSQVEPFRLSVVIVTPDMRYRDALSDAICELDLALAEKFRGRAYIEVASTFRSSDGSSVFAERPERDRSALNAFQSDREFGPLPEEE